MIVKIHKESIKDCDNKMIDVAKKYDDIFTRKELLCVYALGISRGLSTSRLIYSDSDYKSSEKFDNEMDDLCESLGIPTDIIKSTRERF